MQAVEGERSQDRERGRGAPLGPCPAAGGRCSTQGGITLTDGNDDRIGTAPDDASSSLNEPLTRPLPLELGLRIVERELRERARLYELLADG